MRYILSAVVLGATAVAGLPGPATAAPAPAPATDPFPECPNLGYQVQSQDGSTSDLGYFDLNTSVFVPINAVGSAVNAVGYSRNQRLFWGMRTNPASDTLVRIDSQGNTADVGPLDGPLAPATVTTNTGTLDPDDKLYLHTKEPVNELIIVDVDDTDGQVGEVLQRTPLSRTSPGLPYLEIGDWDFSPEDGLLYALELQGDATRLLVTIDPATGDVSDKMDLTDKLPNGHNYGAVYVEDVSGTIYVSNNDVDALAHNGQPGAHSQTFGIYPAQDQVIAYTPGPPLLINDGADCLVATDFGDAPDTYRTLNPNDGPGHIFTEVVLPGKQLRIGTEIDPDLDGIPTPDATGDDTNLPVNDEDGVPPGAVIDENAPSLSVPITNTTGAGAVLAGWLDLDGSGSFEQSERALATLSPSDTNAVLTWPGPVPPRDTFLRLRLYPEDAGADPQPTAAGTPFIWGGEIEDHKVRIGPALAVTGSDTASLAKAGVLLVVCGGLGFLLGGRRRPRPRPRHAAG